jgi:FkbM family methyltransferase
MDSVHHPVFTNFPPWSGRVPEGHDYNFLGVFRSDAFIHDSTQREAASPHQHPPFDEEYFEWIDLLESVASAKGQFTMIELGAGFGRWIVNGGVAARNLGGLPCLLVGVEPEPSHFEWMKIHFRDNGLDPDAHRLICAAAAAKDGSLPFLFGRSKSWYGQAIASTKFMTLSPEELSREIRKQFSNEPGGGEAEADLEIVEAISLRRILQDLPQVDFIDLDVQGAEADVLAAAADELCRNNGDDQAMVVGGTG